MEDEVLRVAGDDGAHVLLEVFRTDADFRDDLRLVEDAVLGERLDETVPADEGVPEGGTEVAVLDGAGRLCRGGGRLLRAERVLVLRDVRLFLCLQVGEARFRVDVVRRPARHGGDYAEHEEPEDHENGQGSGKEGRDGCLLHRKNLSVVMISSTDIILLRSEKTSESRSILQKDDIRKNKNSLTDVRESWFGVWCDLRVSL